MNAARELEERRGRQPLIRCVNCEMAEGEAVAGGHAISDLFTVDERADEAVILTIRHPSRGRVYSDA
jgi:hypothetical protein